jgi:hypothetical protein
MWTGNLHFIHSNRKVPKTCPHELKKEDDSGGYCPACGFGEIAASKQ